MGRGWTGLDDACAGGGDTEELTFLLVLLVLLSVWVVVTMMDG